MIIHDDYDDDILTHSIEPWYERDDVSIKSILGIYEALSSWSAVHDTSGLHKVGGQNTRPVSEDSKSVTQSRHAHIPSIIPFRFDVMKWCVYTSTAGLPTISFNPNFAKNLSLPATPVFLLFSFQARDQTFCWGQSSSGKADTAPLLEILAHGSKFFDEDPSKGWDSGYLKETPMTQFGNLNIQTVILAPRKSRNILRTREAPM